ncbi:hypothetical protein [Dactylosporangium darangshiense]|uniref:hypothetical protein n=1 Tax=Dactylosporangium darangshiense TaxID=579108 RepID=UPI003638AFEA
MTSEPTRLAQKVADAVAELAACLATGVRIDPGRVIAPLMASMGPLHNIAGDLGRTAASVDEEAVAAAQRAAEHFLRARGSSAGRWPGCRWKSRAAPYMAGYGNLTTSTEPRLRLPPGALSGIRHGERTLRRPAIVQIARNMNTST